MINVDVLSEDNNWLKKIKKKKDFFHKVCKAFPTEYQFINKKIFLTLLLSNNKNIKKLNKQFRNKNKSTNILSFPIKRKIKLENNSYLGDIIISYEFMNKPKFLTNLEFKRKVTKIFIHGYLHLLGHDHIKLKDYKKMLRQEEKIYEFINTKFF